MTTNKRRRRFDGPVAKRSVNFEQCIFTRHSPRCEVIRRLDRVVLNIDLGAFFCQDSDLFLDFEDLLVTL